MQKSLMLRLGLGLTVTALVHAVVGPVWGQDFKTILANPERPQNERALDASRKPEEVLKFYGVKPGD
ncbi:MAG: methyltransferase, partial [Candidatus Binatota bacterium]